jgi:hypothetical protein
MGWLGLHGLLKKELPADGSSGINLHVKLQQHDTTVGCVAKDRSCVGQGIPVLSNAGTGDENDIHIRRHAATNPVAPSRARLQVLVEGKKRAQGWARGALRVENSGSAVTGKVEIRRANVRDTWAFDDCLLVTCLLL